MHSTYNSLGLEAPGVLDLESDLSLGQAGYYMLVATSDEADHVNVRMWRDGAEGVKCKPPTVGPWACQAES